MNENLRKLMYDHDFLDKLDSAETEEEVLAIFNDHGIEMTSNKLRILIEEAQKSLASSGELTDEQLKKVAGGVDLKTMDFKKINWRKTVSVLLEAPTHKNDFKFQ